MNPLHKAVERVTPDAEFVVIVDGHAAGQIALAIAEVRNLLNMTKAVALSTEIPSYPFTDGRLLIGVKVTVLSLPLTSTSLKPLLIFGVCFVPRFPPGQCAR